MGDGERKWQESGTVPSGRHVSTIGSGPAIEAL